MTLHNNDSLQALSTIREKLKNRKRLVFVSGNFNIVHPGHIRLLRFAAECGDGLVVGVLGDGSASGAFLPDETRLQSVQAIGCVDYAFILRDPPELFVAALKPAIVVKGKEHEFAVNRELPYLQGYGGKLLFSSGESTFSSIDLIRREIREINFNSIEKPLDFPERHGFSIPDLHATLEAVRALRVCVIGDTIVDEYVSCDPVGMSQEDPTLVVRPVMAQSFVGGAGIVVAHARSLGARVEFISVIGRDQTGKFAAETLEKYGVDAQLLTEDERPTTRKQRYRANGVTLLRVNEFRQHQISKEIQGDILRRVERLIGDIDILIFSDFNYGVLPQDLVDAIAARCRAHNVMMAADSQCSSQIGDISRFKGMSLVTPTEREARIATRDFDSGLVVLAQRLREQAVAENVIITLGREGMLIHASGSGDAQWVTDRLPAFNRSPKDPAGAGDVLFVLASMAVAAKRPIWEAAYLGSLAAACQVGRVGNIPLTSQELHTEIDQ